MTIRSKKLIPIKGGLFAPSFATMEFDTSTPNSAGEMMEDMFRAGADAAIDDFDEGYVDEAFTSELREYAAMEPQIDPALLKEDEERRGKGKEREQALSGGEATKKAVAEPNLRPFKPFRATKTIAKTKARMDKTIPAARTSKRTAKSQPATRSLSATRRTKPAPTKVRKMSDNQLRGHIGGRSVRLHNWNGDVMKGLGDGRGIVVVYTNETDLLQEVK